MPKTPFSIAKILANFNIEIDEIHTNLMTNDSRKVELGDIFCAVVGAEVDGRDYIEKAIAKGAALVIAQCQHPQQHGKYLYKENPLDKSATKVLIVQFFQLNNNLCSLAEQYYHSPQKQIKTIGITGTNGKTSTALTLTKLLMACQKSAAVIGTVGVGKLPNLSAAENTTPSATENLTLMHHFSEQKIDYLTMEVSSHALEQRRVLPWLFDIAVFTNLSRDHLDYHHTMENYAATKFSLFDGNKNQIAIVNADDDYAQTWLKSQDERQVVLFSKSSEACQQLMANYSQYSEYVIANNIQHHESGVTFDITTNFGNLSLESPLLGDFNVDNLLAAIAVMFSLGFTFNDLTSAIKLLTPAIGRMESYKSDNHPLTIVDYAHTPDGLYNALVAAKLHCKGKLWVVFGCGGDRDKGKRKEMGNIAEQYADHIIVTNDNPRTEPPELIVSEILQGCQYPEKITVILDREQAVKSALLRAEVNDCILLAGKGHEDYIVVGAKKVPYNERAFVQKHYQEVIS